MAKWSPQALIESAGGEAILYAAGTVTFQAGRLALNLLAAAVLGPASFGTWVLLTLLIAYSPSLSLGVVNGANREIPYLNGAGRPADAARVADVALTASLGAAAVAMAVAIIIGPTLFGAEEGPLPLLVALFAVALALQQLFGLQQVLFRSHLRFRAAAAQLFILGATVLAVGAPLLAFGLVGLLGAQALVLVVALVLGAWLLPRRPRIAWDTTLARRTAGVGFPIMAAGLVAAVRTTTDRWLVLAFLGLTQVGYYGLVGVVMSGLLILSGIVSQQFYPRIAFAFGQGAGSASLLAMAGRQNRYAAAVVTAAAVPTAIGGWALIPRMLPQYEPAVVPLLIVLIGLVASSASSGYGNLLNTIGAHRRYLGIQLAGLVLNLMLATASLVGGLGIVGVAAASAASMSAYSVALRFAAQRAMSRIVATSR